MPVRVKVRAVIWVGDRIAVHKVNQRGELRVTLPGGRVNERESVIDALRREVREELGIDVNVGQFMFAAEVFSGASHQDVELVFAAQPVLPVSDIAVELVDPNSPGFTVLPPVLDYIVPARDGTLRYLWLGNIYTSQANLPSPVPEQ